MPEVRSAPIIGLVGQLALLGGLAATVGLGAAGWITATAYAAFVCAALVRAQHRAGARFGPANAVTLTRATLVGAVLALVTDGLLAGLPGRVPPGAEQVTAAVAGLDWPEPSSAALILITAVALLLDAADGKVARRTASESALGARFDMEVDAFLILVLSIVVSTTIGTWVLAIGAMRYGYVIAGWIWRWLRRPVPPRYWRKVVAAIQGIVLLVAASGLFPRPLVLMTVAGALALLVESFGRDVLWQWRQRHAAPVPVIPRPRRPLPIELAAPAGGRRDTGRHPGRWRPVRW